MTDTAAAIHALQALGQAPGAHTLPLADLVLTLTPRDPSLTSKEVPVEALFNKLTMMRDKLRVLEQRVNAADGVDVAERAALQAHITAVYTAMASFSALFSDEALPAPPTDAGE